MTPLSLERQAGTIRAARDKREALEGLESGQTEIPWPRFNNQPLIGFRSRRASAGDAPIETSAEMRDLFDELFRKMSAPAWPHDTFRWFWRRR